MKTVLVIEDNADIRENTAEILEMAGYRTLTADNGKKGVDIAMKEHPDLIVCDIMMPELDGYGVLHLIQKNAGMQNTPFIFLTAKVERTELRKGMEMGADDYITKPFEDIELLNAIETRLKKVESLEKKYSLSQQGISEFLKDIKDAGRLTQLAERYEIEQYARKQMLYQAGKRPRFLYFLIKGKAKGYRKHEDGKEYITDIFSAGDFVGYSSLIDNNNYDDNVVILEDAEVLQVPREDFLQMIYGDIQVTNHFIRIIAQNVKEKEERLLNLAYSSLRRRVAKALVEIHKKSNGANVEDKIIEISRNDIAHYIGMTAESVIRTLSDFKVERLIEIHEGKIRIINEEKLNYLVF